MTEVPLFASLATEVFHLDGYIGHRSLVMQPKFDGHRILIDYRGDIPKVLNRNGKVYSARPFKPEIPDLFRGMVLDGEYMWQDDDHVRVFDLLKDVDDPDLNYMRLWHTRVGRLDAVLRHLGDPTWRYVYASMCDSTSLYEFRQLSAKGAHIDGVVIKNTGTPYIPGKGGDWVKYKFTNDIDCVVTRLNIDDKANCELSVVDPLGNQFAIGKASTAGKRVQVNSVVTVRFLKFTDGLRLREPRIVDVRDDKAPRDCGVDQLIPFVPHLAD